MGGRTESRARARKPSSGGRARGRGSRNALGAALVVGPVAIAVGVVASGHRPVRASAADAGQGSVGSEQPDRSAERRPAGRLPGDLGVGFDLVWIPGERSGDAGLFVSRFEVTNRQYREFVVDTGYDGSDHPSSKASEQFLAQMPAGECPEELLDVAANYVNWFHATAFCDWLSRRTGRVVRLPTDEEWGWIAGGLERREYPWGNQWDPRRCNWGDSHDERGFGQEDGFAAMAPVGSFPEGATPEGVMDMAGNAWEWTAERHLRGGPWCLGAEMMRCDAVATEDEQRCDDKFGFRLVVEAE